MWTPYQQFARVHFPELCQERPVNSHKGTFGTVAIIGGNTGMSGAAIMAARAALKMGAGKVKIGFAQDSLPYWKRNLKSCFTPRKNCCNTPTSARGLLAVASTPIHAPYK